MEKISSILPGTPRVTTADLRNSGVARPGAPSFGRPMGVSALAARPEVDGSASASAELSNLRGLREPNARPKDPKADIVERIANNFFNKKAAGVETPVQNDATAEILEKFHAQEDSDLNPMTVKAPTATAEDVDDNAPVVGGKLNIMA